MAVTMNPRRIVGNWISGYALDIHTICSTYMGTNEFGHDVFDNKRSELGELLYRMKYRGDRSAASAIVEAAASFLQRSRNKFDIIVPVPPSGSRRVSRYRFWPTVSEKHWSCQLPIAYLPQDPQRS